jgi:hypothetical protein
LTKNSSQQHGQAGQVWYISNLCYYWVLFQTEKFHLANKKALIAISTNQVATVD